MAEVGGVGEGVDALIIGVPLAASPGNGTTGLAIDVWEDISVGSGSSWPSLGGDSGGGGNKGEEFHFMFIYYNKQ